MKLPTLLLTLGLGATAPVLLPGQSLLVEILRGMASNNNAAAGIATAPSVRVSDAQGKPVSGALVVFTAPAAGASVDFAGDGPMAHVQTDEAGVAVAPRVRPVGANGPLEIKVMVENHGEFSDISLFEMNLGLKSAVVEPEDLDVQLIGVSAPLKRGGPVRVNLRVLGSGKAAAAKVDCTLRLLKPSGVYHDLFHTTALPGEGNNIACEVNVKPGAAVQLVTRASLSGKSATRYFALK